LVVLQMALATVLLVSAGLMIRTFQTLQNVQAGFTNPRELQTLAVFFPESQVKEPEHVLRMQEEILRKVLAIPGVSSAAFANSVPADGNDDIDVLFSGDRPYTEGKLPPLRRFKFIAPGFFQTMGTRLVAGRDITWTVIYDQRPVAMVSENMARELWSNPAAAVGKRVRATIKDPWREIAGVVADVRIDGADQKAPATVYWPVMMRNFWGDEKFIQRRAAFAIRSSRAGSESFINEIRRCVWSVNADAQLADIRTMEQIYRRSMARSSFTLVMLDRRGNGSAAGCHRHLWSHLLFGIAADAGVRDSHRSRGAGSRAKGDGCSPWGVTRRSRRRARSDHGCRANARPIFPTV
jgi:putative ABC transport system permease protein